MNSMRLRPPRPPKERVRPVAAATEVGGTAEKVSVFGVKVVSQRAARHDSAARGCLPLRGEGCLLDFSFSEEISLLLRRLSVLLSPLSSQERGGAWGRAPKTHHQKNPGSAELPG